MYIASLRWIGHFSKALIQETCMRFFILFILIISMPLFAQKASPYQNMEIIPGIHTLTTNRSQAVPARQPVSRSLQDRVPPGSPTEMARTWLRQYGPRYGLDHNMEYALIRVQNLPGGYRVKYHQTLNDIPVYHASLVLSMTPSGHVFFMSNSFKPLPSPVNTWKLDRETAQALAAEFLNTDAPPHKARKMVFVFNQTAYRVWYFNYAPSKNNYGDWDILVNAGNGALLSARDRAFYHSPTDSARGYVYDPDPLTRSRARYGDSGYSDNNDQDSPQLSAQRVLQALPFLTYKDSLFQLVSPYAQIIDAESPGTGLHSQDSAFFNFSRSQNGFEAVNVFYHIHMAMAYINDTLGIPLMPFQYSGGVRFDPHGLNGDDNSHYTSQGYVAFGDGGVADAEDPDVILHELGHGLHDWLTDGLLSQVDGLSEGCGDYWAASYRRRLHISQPGDHDYDWVFNWDGHNTFWSGRVTDYNAHYPEGLVGQIHTDGQMWASSLMEIYDRIGREATDRNFLIGLSMLNESSSQRDAAYAFIEADNQNYGGAHLNDILPVFIQRGYVTDSITVNIRASVTGGRAPLTVRFSENSIAYPDSIHSWEWDFDNDGIIDSHERAPLHTYTQPGLYTVTLTVTNSASRVTKSHLHMISVNKGFFLWDATPETADNGADFLQERFNALSIPVRYSLDNPLPDSLTGYRMAFLNFENRSLTAREDSILTRYLKNGGRLYLEGGPALNTAGDSLLARLGLTAIQNGYAHEIGALTGGTHTWTADMTFKGVKNPAGNENRLLPGDADTLFHESGYGVTATAYQGGAGSIAVVSSYSARDYLEQAVPHTRDDFLSRLVHYLGYDHPPYPRFIAAPRTGHAPLTVHFTNQSLFYLDSSQLTWSWDMDGDLTPESAAVHPVHTFTDPNTYPDITLTVTSDSGSTTVQYGEYLRVFNGESALASFGEEAPATARLTLPADNIPALDSNFTFEGWFRLEEEQDKAYLLDKTSFNIYYLQNALGRYNANSLVVYLKTDAGTSIYNTPAGSFLRDAWYHIAVSYESDSVTVFLNGRPQTLTLIGKPPAGPVAENRSMDLTIGNSADGTHVFRGYLDDIYLWRPARAAYDLKELVNAYPDTTDPGLIFYFNCNEAAGDTVYSKGMIDKGFAFSDFQWDQGRPAEIVTALPDSKAATVPVTFRVWGNYPNPFNPETRIRFSLPRDGKVRLTVYNTAGQRVALKQGVFSTGFHEMTWRANNLASGLYYYQLEWHDGRVRHIYSSKMLLLK